MSQKIVIPKGTIDSAHTTVIEIPNYLHETSMVVVTTPKTTDSSTDQFWEVDEYQEDAEQNETDWEQSYEAQETNEEAEYPPEQQQQQQQPEQQQEQQYESYQYEAGSEEVDSGSDTQQPDDQGLPYADYVEETPAEPVRRPKADVHSEQMRRRMLVDKKRELLRMRAERQRLLEGAAAVYEAVPQSEIVTEDGMHLAEVPANMRARSATREGPEDRKRRPQEFERRQFYPPQMRSRHEVAYNQRDRSAPKYLPAKQDPQYAMAVGARQQWNPDVQRMQRYNNGPYVHQGQPRPPQVPVYPPRRQMGGQVNFAREEFRQSQKARRRPVFGLPRN